MRPYQQDAIDSIRREFLSGNRKVLLHLSTGGGKTHIFSDILKRTAERGRKCMMVVRGVELVNQAHRRLLHEGVPHGVRMASHYHQNYQAPIQICSIDTLTAREEFPEADLVVIDEVHLFTSKLCRSFLEHYSSSYILGVTATPYTTESLRHVADTVVHPISMLELMRQGYLVPPRYFAPSTPDLKGVRTVSGDFDQTQLAERMGVLTGDIVGHWKNLVEGRPTICFAVNIKHSESIVEQFLKAGVKAEHVEAKTSKEDRESAIRRLRTGETKVLSNVGILCTGVDIPEASAILMARPTKSYSLFIQQAGRGTRPAEGKKDFIVLDHAGNILRHGFITDDPEAELDGIPKGEKKTRLQTCEQCFVVFEGSACHVCGHKQAPKEKKEIEHAAGALKELKHLPEGVEISIFIKREKEIAKRRGFKRGWVYHRVAEKYGAEVAGLVFKKREIPFWIKK